MTSDSSCFRRASVVSHSGSSTFVTTTNTARHLVPRKPDGRPTRSQPLITTVVPMSAHPNSHGITVLSMWTQPWLA